MDGNGTTLAEGEVIDEAWTLVMVCTNVIVPRVVSSTNNYRRRRSTFFHASHIHTSSLLRLIYIGGHPSIVLAAVCRMCGDVLTGLSGIRDYTTFLDNWLVVSSDWFTIAMASPHLVISCWSRLCHLAVPQIVSSDVVASETLPFEWTFKSEL